MQSNASPNSGSTRNVTFDPISRLLKQADPEESLELSGPDLDKLLNQCGIDLNVNPDIPEAEILGRELMLSLRNTREFGMVISAGLGGSQAELIADSFRRDRAVVSASTALTDANTFLNLFKRTYAYQRLIGPATDITTEGQDGLLVSIFEGLIGLANYLSGENTPVDFVLDNLELNPLVMRNGQLTAMSARCKFAQPAAPRLAPPLKKIDNLLHPQSIGIIGVSASKMNFGRIILNNLIANGYDKAKMTIIRPGETEIDGVKCAESMATLDTKLDLFIVAVAADAVYGLVDEIIETDAAESVMLIPGGLGETQKSVEPAAAMAARINAAHASDGGGPIFLGANCLGVVSHPGAYDSWFIPQERLPKTQKKQHRNSALVSQSGAFMITRLSRNPWLDPAYMIALGNQTDLTHGDMLSYFVDNDEIDTIGIYIEGFRDLDGLKFARAVRQAVLNGKQVVVYKAGKTEPGKGAALGHTASIAGDYVVCESVLRQAGAIVVKDLNEFDDVFYIASEMHDKKIGGNRLGAISGAGFEAVGMSDSIRSESFSMELGAIEPATVARVQEILEAKRLNTLVEVRNPIDINPGADDEAHLQITEAFATDPNVDAVVVGLDPTAPAIRALPESSRPGHNIHHELSSVQLMPDLVSKTDKPIIGIVDGGTLFDPMAEGLMDKGVCVFRTCSRGVEALTRYIEARLNAEEIRRRNT